MRKSYFENLDALRFLAAIMVFVYHLTVWMPINNQGVGKIIRILFSMDTSGGDAGVKFFFVLSGFLITFLMFEEDNQSSGFHIMKFYIRRSLRIWPLYFLTLFIGFVVYPFIIQSPGFEEKASPLLYCTFLANFDNILWGSPKTGILGVQWSVSVEEQFYLLWPILFLFFRKGSRFVWLVCLLFVTSYIYGYHGGHPYHIFSCVRELSLGALGAWLCFFHLPSVEKILNFFSRKVTVILYVVGIASIFLNFQSNKHFPEFSVWHSIFNSFFYIFVIIDQNYSARSSFKAGSLPWLTYWGKRSYGLYLLHMVAISLALLLNTSLFMKILLSIVGTFVFSFLSYRYVEKPFLNLKMRFE